MRTNIKRIIIVLLLLGILSSLVFGATRTFRATEGDFIKITLDSVDPDRDQVTNSFSEPLDEKGEWQTTYDDAGEYLITVKVSDGVNVVEEQIRLIILNKNQPPVLLEETIVIKETQTVEIKQSVSDPDDDPLEFTFNEPFDKDGKWQTDYSDGGEYIATFEAFDGEFHTEFRIRVEVIETNQPPTIIEKFANEELIDAKENDEINFFIEAEDNDGNDITFSWTLDGQEISTQNSGKYQFDFNSAGEHLLQAIVDDGSATTTNQWVIDVKNKNRKPDFKHSPILVKEGEIIQLNLPKKDADGDDLEYTFEEPLRNGKWQTDFDDSGEYKVGVTVSDDLSEIEGEVYITVLNVDRAPKVILPRLLEVEEGELLKWTINTSDPDGDKIEINIPNAPEGSELKGKEFRWEPDFDTIKRSGGVMSKVLNFFRLEHYFLSNFERKLEIEICGKELCTIASVPLKVINVNRKPTLDVSENIYVQETQQLHLEASAIDPDGDIINYYYTEPLDETGTWDTDFGDKGDYTVYVTATDGRVSETVPVNIHVTKMNRAPSLSIKHDDIVVNEGQEFTLKVDADDPDNDSLTLTVQNITEGASFFDNTFVWAPPHTIVKEKMNKIWNNVMSRIGYLNKRFNPEKEVQWVEFAASDGEYDVIHPVKVTVKNVNKRPQIIDFLPESGVVVNVNEPVIFHVVATDIDNDQITYTWNFGFHEEQVKGTDTVERVFVTPGRKVVTVFATDGRDRVKKTWVVNVLPEEILEQPKGQFRILILDV